MAKTALRSKNCTKCGDMLPMSSFYTSGKKKSGETKYASWCKSCICQKQASYHKRTWGQNSLHRTAFKRSHSVKSYLSYLRGKALQRSSKKEIISLDALELLWVTQGGKCALTGWDMTIELGRGVVHTNCSIDRIDSSGDYEVGNVQLVCRIANTAKSNLTFSEFLALCRSVVEVNRE